MTQPALPFSPDTGPMSHDGQMSTTSPLLPTPTHQPFGTMSSGYRDAAHPGVKKASLEHMMRHGLTSSSAATPASQQATLESGRAKRMTAGSGRSSPESLASLDRAWFYSKTYRAFSQWKETSMPPLTDAYAAGLIDGEGCIGISESNKRTQPTYGVRVEVGMSEKALPLLRQMEATFGGTIRQTRKASAKWEAAWTWGLFSAQQASNFLMRIEPHLVLKGEQARSALRLLAMLDDLPKDKRGRPRWTVQTRKDAASLRALVMDMNRKGPTTTEQVGWLARYVGGQWLTDQRSLLDPTGWEKFSGTWPRSGMTRDGRLYALPTSALPTVESDGSASLNVPTPTASDAIWGDKDHSRNGIVGNHNLGLTDWVKTLPTPQSWLGHRPAHSEIHQAPREASEQHEGDRGRRSVELTDALGKLLPTPDTKSDAFATTPRQEADFETNHAVSLGHALNHLLPSPTQRDHKGPRTGDYEPGDMLPEAIDKLLPTPRTPTGGPEPTSMRRARGNPHGTNLEASIGDLTDQPSDGGKP